MIIDGALEGRKADFSFVDVEPKDPHALATFEKSKLHWSWPKRQMAERSWTNTSS